MKMIKFFLIWVFIVSTFTAYTQQSTTNVVIDKNYFGHGEILHGFIGFGGVNVHDKTLQVAVYNCEDDSVVDEFFIQVNNDVADFYVPIMNTYDSGTYSLRVSTLASRLLLNDTKNIIYENKEIAWLHLGDIFFYVIDVNDKINQESKYFLKESTDCVETLQLPTVIDVTKTDSFDIGTELRVDKTCCLAVISDLKYFKNNESCNVATFQNIWTQDVAESFSKTIFSAVKVKDTNGKMKFNLLGLISTETMQLTLGKSNESGIVFFTIGKFEGKQDFQLLFNKNETNFLDFEILLNKGNQNEKVSEIDGIYYKQIFEETKTRHNVHAHFDVVPLSFLEGKRLPKTSMDIKHQKQFIIKDYKNFSNIISFFKENTIPVNFVLENGKYKSILSPPSHFTKGYNVKWENPTFLVDGIIVFDLQEVIDLKMSDIVEIKIFYDQKETKKWLSAFGSNGIIQIKTKNGKSVKPENSLNSNGYQRDILGVNETIRKNMVNGLPDISNTVFWMTLPYKSQKEIFLFNNADKTEKYLLTYYFDNNILKRKIRKMVF